MASKVWVIVNGKITETTEEKAQAMAHDESRTTPQDGAYFWTKEQAEWAKDGYPVDPAHPSFAKHRKLTGVTRDPFTGQPLNADV